MLPRYKDIVELLKKGSTIEAQEQIMALREGALELQEENQELKRRIHELELRLQAIDDWKHEAERYCLAKPWGGAAQVYALRGELANGEEAHYLCPNCFHSKKKSILTPNKKNAWVLMVCPACKATLETGYKGIGGPQYVENIEKKG